MSRRANSLQIPAEGVREADLDAAWEEMPVSTAVPLGTAPRTPAPASASSLPPVTIVPRPRSSSRAPAMTAGPLFTHRGSAGGARAPVPSPSPGAEDEPTLEIGSQFLDEALLELGEGARSEPPPKTG